MTNPPSLEGMSTHFGVSITFVGDDGDRVFMLGHVEPRRALAALNRYTRKDLGWTLAREGFIDSARSVMEDFEHRWAVLKTHCNDYPNCPNKVPYRGEQVCGYCREIEDAGWWVYWGEDVTAETLGAFPATVLEM